MTAYPITYATTYWTARNPRRTVTNYIVIHHAAASYRLGDAVRAIYNFHRGQWPAYNAAGYHMILQREVDNTISINLVNDPWIIGAGVANHNHHSFHICLADNFVDSIPDEVWLAAAKVAVAFAKNLFPTATVVGHRELGQTTCPGNRWFEWKPALADIPSPLALWVQTTFAIPHGNAQNDGAQGSEQNEAQSGGRDGVQNNQSSVQGTVVAYPETAPIIGVPIIPRERAINAAVGLLIARPYRTLPPETIRHIVETYADIGTVVGVDWLCAIAQMIHETGGLTSFFSQPPRHNLAGIGVTGAASVAPREDPLWHYDPQRNKWVYGVSFPSYEHAVRAHLGRLLAYALPKDRRSNEQQACINEALSYRALPLQLHGSAPRWIDLNGKWAVPGQTYGQRIIQIANQIINSV